MTWRLLPAGRVDIFGPQKNLHCAAFFSPCSCKKKGWRAWIFEPFFAPCLLWGTRCSIALSISSAACAAQFVSHRRNGRAHYQPIPPSPCRQNARVQKHWRDGVCGASLHTRACGGVGGSVCKKASTYRRAQGAALQSVFLWKLCVQSLATTRRLRFDGGRGTPCSMGRVFAAWTQNGQIYRSIGRENWRLSLQDPRKRGSESTTEICQKSVPRGMWGSHRSRADVSRDRWTQSPRDKLQEGGAQNFHSTTAPPPCRQRWLPYTPPARRALG